MSTGTVPCGANVEYVPGPTVRVYHDGRITMKDAAAFLGVSQSALVKWNKERRGPKQKRIGGRIFYDFEAIKRVPDEGLEAFAGEWEGRLNG